jgi:hypothetical protein
MSEWISVKDRLPEIGIRRESRNLHGRVESVYETSDLVMTFNPNGLDGKSSFQSRLHLQRRISYIEEGDKWVHGGVTHWQPLPELPEIA